MQMIRTAVSKTLVQVSYTGVILMLLLQIIHLLALVRLFCFVKSEALNAIYEDTTALCPVLYSNLTLSSSATVPHVNIKGGQQLFFESERAKIAYMRNPRQYWLSPYDMPNLDHMQGAPNVMKKTIYCPITDEEVEVNMQTPRVLHRNGQAIYFCCWGCLQKFWADPSQILRE